MSQIDRAFIKAYQQQQADRAMPAAGGAPAAKAAPAITLPGGVTAHPHAAHDGAAAQSRGRVPTPHMPMLAYAVEWMQQRASASAAENAAPPKSNSPSSKFGRVDATAGSAAVASPHFSAAAHRSNVGMPWGAAPVAPPLPSKPRSQSTQAIPPKTPGGQGIEATLLRIEGSAPTEIRFERLPVEHVIPLEETDFALVDDEPLIEEAAPAAPVVQPPSVAVNEQAVAAQEQTTSAAESTETEAVIEAAHDSAVATETPAAAKTEVAAAVETPAPAAAPQTPQFEAPVSAASQTVLPKFQPQWEVDAFAWPKGVVRLLAQASKELEQACMRIREAVRPGQNVIAVTGASENAGATTLALALARRLAAGGLRVALVDADFDRPALAERLGVGVQQGWEAALAGAAPLDEAAIASVDDKLVLLPLAAQPGVNSSAANMQAAAHIEQLAARFDLVLIDAGSGSENVAAVIASTEDALPVSVLLAVDQRKIQPAEIQEVVGHLRHCGVASIQVGQTFVSA